jgi:hypothetical protein
MYLWGLGGTQTEMAEMLVPLTGLEPVTPSLRIRGIRAKVRFLRPQPQGFPQFRPVSFRFRSSLWYTGTQRADGSYQLPTGPGQPAIGAPDVCLPR